MDLREGRAGDDQVLLALFDEAVAWLVARGQTGQWGSEPFSQRPAARRQVEGFVAGGGLTIAELEREPVGALVLGEHPEHVPAVSRPERYIELLLTSRRHAGKRIGSELVAHAVSAARAGRAELLRVDCWAGAPALVGWYERQGFVKSGRFELRGWEGQVFEMEL